MSNLLLNVDYFKDTLSTLKEMSYDSEEKVSMTDSNIQGYNFDLVKRYYTNSLHLSEEVAKSVDTIYYCEKNNSYIFIEFKNGNMKNEKANVRQKVRDSLLMFCDMIHQNISFTRTNVDLILVYNKKKNKKKSNNAISANSQNNDYGREELINHLFDLSNEHEILFGLQIFKTLYFRDVFTYNEEEFNSKIKELFI